LPEDYIIYVVENLFKKVTNTIHGKKSCNSRITS